MNEFIGLATVVVISGGLGWVVGFHQATAILSKDLHALRTGAEKRARAVFKIAYSEGYKRGKLEGTNE